MTCSALSYPHSLQLSAQHVFQAPSWNELYWESGHCETSFCEDIREKKKKGIEYANLLYVECDFSIVSLLGNGLMLPFIF